MQTDLPLFAVEQPLSTPTPAEGIRLAPARAAVLKRLQAGPATTMELVAVGGIRATGRVTELRQAGHRITAKATRPGRWVYTLE